MPLPPPSSPALPPELFAELQNILLQPALSDQGVQVVRLEDQVQKCLFELTTTGSEADTEGLRNFLNVILLRLAQDKLVGRASLQQAQFRTQHYQSTALSGEIKNYRQGESSAFGRLIARALQAVPGWKRPMTIADLVKTPRPGFSDEFPKALRHDGLKCLRLSPPQVSVIIPTWNRAHIVTNAISSALLQSYAPGQVIVVDDGSTDGTIPLIQSHFGPYLETGQLVLLEVGHGGVAAARNAGLAAATGEIIAYLDSDNSWETDHLLFACAALQTTGANMAYTALCRHNLTDGWSDILFRPYDRAALEEQNYIDLNSVVHRTELYNKLGGFDTDLTRLVDWDLGLRYGLDNPPVAVPVITGHYFTETGALQNITTTEALEPNIARIRTKLQTR